MCADVAKALGRISSGLYVVTASQQDARSAMVASWVSQAGHVHGVAGRSHAQSCFGVFWVAGEAIN